MSALLLMHYSNGRGVINAQIKRTDKANSKYCFLITPRESERRVQQKGKRGKQNALSWIQNIQEQSTRFSPFDISTNAWRHSNWCCLCKCSLAWVKLAGQWHIVHQSPYTTYINFWISIDTEIAWKNLNNLMKEQYNHQEFFKQRLIHLNDWFVVPKKNYQGSLCWKTKK